MSMNIIVLGLLVALANSTLGLKFTETDFVCMCRNKQTLQ